MQRSLLCPLRSTALVLALLQALMLSFMLRPATASLMPMLTPRPLPGRQAEWGRAQAKGKGLGKGITQGLPVVLGHQRPQ